MSTPSTASTLLAVTRMPCAAASCCRRSARGWLATTFAGSTSRPRRRPAIMDSAITPVPTVASVRPSSGDMPASLLRRPGTPGGEEEEAPRRRDRHVPEAGRAHGRGQLVRLVEHLRDRERAPVNKAPEGEVGRTFTIPKVFYEPDELA